MSEQENNDEVDIGVARYIEDPVKREKAIQRRRDAKPDLRKKAIQKVKTQKKKSKEKTESLWEKICTFFWGLPEGAQGLVFIGLFAVTVFPIADFMGKKMGWQYTEEELKEKKAAKAQRNFEIIEAIKDNVSKIFEDSVPLSSLQNRGINGWFEKNAEKGFTGAVYEKWPNGEYKLNARMKDGKYNGEMKVWYEDGQKLMEGSFSSGNFNGENIVYHQNGNKAGVMTFKDGSPVDGAEKVWDSSGRRILDEAKAKRMSDEFIEMTRSKLGSSFRL